MELIDCQCVRSREVTRWAASLFAGKRLAREVTIPEAVILVADDEPLIRLLMQSALESAGWALIEASNGLEAINCVERHHDQLSAFVTDVRLGRGPDGWQIASRARELSSEVGIVYVTGDSAHEWHSKGVPNSVLIQKPFYEPELIAAISSIIGPP